MAANALSANDDIGEEQCCDVRLDVAGRSPEEGFSRDAA